MHGRQVRHGSEVGGVLHDQLEGAGINPISDRPTLTQSLPQQAAARCEFISVDGCAFPLRPGALGGLGDGEGLLPLECPSPIAAFGSPCAGFETCARPRSDEAAPPASEAFAG